MTTASGYLRLKLFNPEHLSNDPSVVLKIRNFMKSCEYSSPAKKCFIEHGTKWLNPKTAALSLISDHPSPVDVTQMSSISPNIEELLWSERPLSAFLTNESSTFPCLTVGSREDWLSFRNNNIMVERLIGQIRNCVLDKKSSRF